MFSYWIAVYRSCIHTCIHIVLLTIYHMTGYCCQILKDIFNYCKGHVEGFVSMFTIQLRWQGLPVSIHCVSVATDTLYMGVGKGGATGARAPLVCRRS